MQTVGQILKQVREEAFYTLEEVEKATKIRKELLEALEADDYSKLPPATFVQGFIKNYAKFLKIDSQKLLAVFRREFSDRKHTPYVMDAFSNPLDERLKITPGKVVGVVVSLIIISFFVYLWVQYRNFVGAPSLIVKSPPDQLSAETSSVVVEGKTDPEIQVMVNNQKVAVESNGEFSEKIKLSSQVNIITIVAVSKFGQKTEVSRTVYLKSDNIP